MTLVHNPFPPDPARFSRALFVRTTFPLVDLGGGFGLVNHRADVGVLEVHRPQRVNVLAGYRENLDELVSELGCVVGQCAQFVERVA